MIIATKPETWRLPSFSKFEIGRTHAVTRTFTEMEVDAFGYLSADPDPGYDGPQQTGEAVLSGLSAYKYLRFRQGLLSTAAEIRQTADPQENGAGILTRLML
ncbi:hypothetical protein [Bradyrhizobium paxllaeri]|uniref:hypothetical protein n=1 Tax=Bradyrhizobium paxllaeri TaxID=190148 RepID=UPI0008108F0D|nr:hypothetical protein [Bradyrhizobium paxllaeri]